MDNKERLDLLEKTIVRLAEHFSAIEVVATSEDGASSVRYQFGVGPYYERFGLVRSWLLRAEEQEVAADPSDIDGDEEY